MDNLMQIINEFLIQAHKGDLKTSSYPREWSGLKMKVSFGMGAPARIPWIAFIAPEMQVSKGFYRLRKKHFTTKAESMSKKRKGKRQYLNNLQTRDLMKRFHRFFEFEVEVPRIRIGKRQTIETLINEEALLLAKFLRDERKTWASRIAVL